MLGLGQRDERGREHPLVQRRRVVDLIERGVHLRHGRQGPAAVRGRVLGLAAGHGVPRRGAGDGDRLARADDRHGAQRVLGDLVGRRTASAQRVGDVLVQARHTRS